MICKTLAISFLAFLSTVEAQIEGKYVFECHDFFDEFIGAVVGNSGGNYKDLVSATPKYEITACDDKYNITRITGPRIAPFQHHNVYSFNLGEPVVADPLGADLPAEYITTLEDGALVSRAGVITISREFGPNEMILKFSKGPINARQQFKRIE